MSLRGYEYSSVEKTAEVGFEGERTIVPAPGGKEGALYANMLELGLNTRGWVQGGEQGRQWHAAGQAGQALITTAALGPSLPWHADGKRGGGAPREARVVTFKVFPQLSYIYWLALGMVI